MQIIKMPKKSFNKEISFVADRMMMFQEVKELKVALNNKESFRITSTKLSAPVDVKYSTEEEVWSICYNSIKKTMEFSLN